MTSTLPNIRTAIRITIADRWVHSAATAGKNDVTGVQALAAVSAKPSTRVDIYLADGRGIDAVL